MFRFAGNSHLTEQEIIDYSQDLDSDPSGDGGRISDDEDDGANEREGGAQLMTDDENSDNDNN